MSNDEKLPKEIMDILDKFSNQVIEGDCLEVMKDIPDKSIDLVLTDPPYKIGAKGCGLAGDRKYLHDITNENLDEGFDFNVMNEIERVLKTMNLIIFCGRLQLKDFIDYVYKKEFKWNLICWHKTNPTPLTNNNYLPDTEYIFHIWKDRKLTGNYHTKKKFYVLSADQEKFSHPTTKPLSLIKNMIINGSDENDLILDPFLGSGTTAVAAKQLKRNYIGIEISEKYVEIAKQRLKQETLF